VGGAIESETYSGLVSPAGLCLNDSGNVLAIPHFDGNSVSFYSGIYSGIELSYTSDNGEIRVYGNELVISFTEPCLTLAIYSLNIHSIDPPAI
jgi:hypothetical protein